METTIRNQMWIIWYGWFWCHRLRHMGHFQWHHATFCFGKFLSCTIIWNNTYRSLNVNGISKSHSIYICTLCLFMCFQKYSATKKYCLFLHLNKNAIIFIPLNTIENVGQFVQVSMCWTFNALRSKAVISQHILADWKPWSVFTCNGQNSSFDNQNWNIPGIVYSVLIIFQRVISMFEKVSP